MALRGAALCLVLGSLAAAQENASDAGVSPEPIELDAGTSAPEAALNIPLEPAADLAPALELKPEATGYVTLRTSYARSRVNGLLPTADLPQFQALLEVNGQVKVTYHPRSFIYTDVSAVAFGGGNYRALDASGTEVIVATRDAPGLRPQFVLNEVYALHELRHDLNLLLGKKRLVWGSGFSYNPTDLLNIRKDPTDPTFLRTGAWLARIEVPLETLAFSAVFAPAVIKQNSTIPYQFLTYPEWDAQDTEAHYLAILRAYALVADADVNLMFFYGNKYNDDFSKKFRFGASFSRYFFTDYELHFETLIQAGSPRDYIQHGCVTGPEAVLACLVQQQPFVTKQAIDDSTLLPRLLVGGRRQFSDESLLNIEYLYQADGFTKTQFQDFVSGLDLMKQARQAGLPVDRVAGASDLLGGSSTEAAQRFSFQPLTQHYLFVTYQKPRIRDDFTAQLVAIVNLQDLSSLWSPSISWTTTQWLTLTAFGFIPLPGPNSLAATTSDGRYVSEYTLMPQLYRFMLEARIFY